MGVLVLLISAILATAPASAWAQTTIAPPGNSGVAQYFESVPSAGGNAPPAQGDGSGIDRKTDRALQAAGSEGRALAQALRAAPAPPLARAAASDTRKGSGPEQPAHKAAESVGTRNPSAESGSAGSLSRSVATAFGGDSGSSGSGWALPIFLLVSALAVAAVAAVRRTSS